jgi:dihydrofolate reductase
VSAFFVFFQLQRKRTTRKETTMGKVLFGLSVSLDGFLADTQGDPSLLFAWMGRAMEQLHEVVGDTLFQTGAVIMGHRTFDEIDNEQGWVWPDGTAPDCLSD